MSLFENLLYHIILLDFHVNNLYAKKFYENIKDYSNPLLPSMTNYSHA